MGELNERRWAVVSERGREAAGLVYAEAGELVRSLRAEKVSGLCVITDEAALRLPQAKKTTAKRASGDGSRKPKRRARKGAA